MAGLGKFSFWWALMPAFFAGALGLANGRHYHAVVQANWRGVVWLFPTQLVIYTASNLLGAAVVYWLTRWIA